MSDDAISLTVTERQVTGKAVKHLRKDGTIPAVIHDHGKDSISVQGDAVQMLKVWKKAGKNTYKLNHFALSWDPSGTVFVGPANIRENVTLNAQGNSFSGTFTIDQFDTNGNTLAHIVGKITAQRVTPD